MLENQKNKGKRFITIEGLDGSGKSTQINLLKKYLNMQNMPFKFIHFPMTDSPKNSPIYGEMVSNFLKGEYGDVQQVNPYLVALLYAGDRNNAKSIINEWLEKDYFILLDRYVYSNIAYQCAKVSEVEKKRKLKEWIFHLEYEYNKIPKPSFSLFLQMNFDFVCSKLKDNRQGSSREYLAGKTDIHEKDLELQKKVEKEYIQLVGENSDFHLIKCANESGHILSPENINKKIINLLIENDFL